MSTAVLARLVKHWDHALVSLSSFFFSSLSLSISYRHKRRSIPQLCILLRGDDPIGEMK